MLSELRLLNMGGKGRYRHTPPKRGQLGGLVSGLLRVHAAKWHAHGMHIDIRVAHLVPRLLGHQSLADLLLLLERLEPLLLLHLRLYHRVVRDYAKPSVYYAWAVPDEALHLHIVCCCWNIWAWAGLRCCIACAFGPPAPGGIPPIRAAGLI